MLSYFAHVLQDLKLDPVYDGFLFLAESARNPPSLRSHHHAEIELNIVARGTVTYVAAGQRLTFGPRSLLWMFPAQEHQLVDRTNDAQYYVAVFKPDLIARSCHGEVYKALKRKKSEGGRVLHTVLDPETFGFLRRMLADIMDGSIDPDILNREAGFGVGSDFRYRHDDPDGLNAGLHHLLLLCWRIQQACTTRQSSVSLHPSISKAITLLGNDSWSGSLGHLAKECGLSEAHFSRMFARQVGVPLSRYRNSLRLARFWEYFRRPAKPTILEAVYAAGFGSYAQFYKVFADAYGEGPRACLRLRP
jgi:AraC-like DNA-binding protein